jgi:hypothetical protein
VSGVVRWNVTASALSETVMPWDRSHGLPTLQQPRHSSPGSSERPPQLQDALDPVTKVLGTNELSIGVSDPGPAARTCTGFHRLSARAP